MHGYEGDGRPDRGLPEGWARTESGVPYQPTSGFRAWDAETPIGKRAAGRTIARISTRVREESTFAVDAVDVTIRSEDGDVECVVHLPVEEFIRFGIDPDALLERLMAEAS